jgi:uncharacterized protein (DUF1015 family)
MARIEPFRGIRYNPDKVENLDLVMAPPYDIIPPGLQIQLYDKHPHNVVRLELNRQTPGDTDGDNRYTRAAAHLGQWLEADVLVQDARTMLYVYFLDYVTPEREEKTLKGFLSRVHLEELDSGVVLPHENTLSGPKADRLRLMQSCQANFSPIFSLYSNPQRGIVTILDATARTEPLIHVSDLDGVRHRVWSIDDASTIARIQKVMAERPLFIADGHHRYETALTYRNLRREETGMRDGRQPFDHVLMYFSNMDDPGLSIFPTHRLIDHLHHFDLHRFLGQIADYFKILVFPFVQKDPFLQELKSVGQTVHAFGLYSCDSDDLYLLTLKPGVTMEPLLKTALSPVLRSLDVTLLHSVLLEHFLGIGEKELAAQSHVRYVKETEDAFHAVNDRDAQLAFLMNGTRVDQLRDVSLQGEKMPQKSTYFYPKLLTGLVLNTLRV